MLATSYKQHPWWWYLGVTLLVRLWYGWLIFPWMWEGDAGEYVGVAAGWLQGEVGDFYWPPGLPALLSSFLGISGISKVSSSLLMLCGWCAWIYAMRYLLGRNPAKWEWRGLWIFGLWPAWIHQAVVPLTHLWVGVFLLLSIYLLRKNTSFGKGVLAGACLLMAIWLRPATILVCVCMLVYVGWKEGINRKLVAVALFPFTGILCWQLFSYHQTGTHFFINKASVYNLYLGNHPETPMYKSWWLGSHAEDWPQFPAFQAEVDSVRALPEVTQSVAYRDLSLLHIAEHPGEFLLRTLNRVRVFWAFDTFTGAWWYPRNNFIGQIILGIDAICYLSFMSICLLFWHPTFSRDKVKELSLLTILAYGLPYYLAFSHPTYHFAIIPLFLFLGEWKKKPTMTLTKWGILFLLIGIQLEWIFHMSSSL
ncbi:MAG: hypothetical protein AAF824_02440 [Bacteroidota bacterium]